MKTTLDLPDDLVRQLKLRALMDGRKLKDSVADVLRAGLAVRHEGETEESVFFDETTGLPAVRCRGTVGSAKGLTPEELDHLLVEQEAEWARNAG